MKPDTKQSQARDEAGYQIRAAEKHKGRNPPFCLHLIGLHTKAVRNAFAEKSIVYMVADWTLYDEHITALLGDYQRNGIPLYLLYMPGEPRARVLPQILTENSILKVLDTVD